VGTLINYGQCQQLHIRNESPIHSTGLIKFDLSSIEPTVEVVSATLSLYLTVAHQTSQWRVYKVETNWTEGTNSGDGIGAANWITAEVGTNWTTPGGDYSTAYDDIIPLVEGEIGFLDIPLRPQMVEDWINNPNSNYGVAIYGMASCWINFYSSEYSNKYYRPVLKVLYYKP